MILIWGHKYDVTPLGTVPLNCPKCGKSPITFNHAVKKFTAYWIPLWTSEELFALKCPTCNDDSLYPIDAEHVPALKAVVTPT